ncbi:MULTISPECIES: DUF4186 domain-containing protein [unclassified Streptomyces]|uniref:DUF4186 domain-containing protein n=1 Tax=unclassified Streptomyces TaxID=2593676 RepID=UPI00037334AC|nr:MULTISPECIES: DUF4186 domain-containing protein [unclassified Streptomyces]
MASSPDTPAPDPASGPTPVPASGPEPRPTPVPAAGPGPRPATGPGIGPATGPGPGAGPTAAASPADAPAASPASAPAPPSAANLDRRIDVIGRQPFRAKFHLRGRDLVTAQSHGPATLRWHARDLIAQRLAPAEPYKDGKQTPYRGHPVFVAQHATATCCRSCLRRWHEIPKGRELSRAERAYVVEVICRWIEREVAGA